MTITAQKCPNTLKHVLHTKQNDMHRVTHWTAGAHPQVFLSVGRQSKRSVLTGSTLLALNSDQNITTSAATFLNTLRRLSALSEDAPVRRIREQQVITLNDSES